MLRTSTRRPCRFRWFLPLLLPMLFLLRPAQQDRHVYALHAPAAAVSAPVQSAALPPDVRPGLPQGETRLLAVPERRLQQGRLLLIDEAHPLPDGYIPADTLSVVHYSEGRITCRDAAIVCGQDTLAALQELFLAARSERVVQLTVFAGTRSREQQRLLQTDVMAELARDMPLEDALRAARQAVASPDCSEHQTCWAVDVRVCPDWNGLPDAGPLSASAAGRWLESNCWRFGFILRWPEASPAPHSCRAYHLRYVGRAHAMLMHALDVTLEEYLALLAQHGTLTLYHENNAPLACAVCVPAGEQQTSFILPECDVEDLSLDNLGHAVAGCIFSGSTAEP